MTGRATSCQRDASRASIGRRAWRRLRRRARPDSGFTLVEVVVAMGLLMIVLVSCAQFLADSVVAEGNLRNRTVAANLADQMMETYRQEPFSVAEQGADGAPTTTTQKVGSITYTETTVKRWQPTNVSGICSNGNGSPSSTTAAVLLVEAEVSWPAMNGTPPVAATTTIAEPFTSGATLSGSLQLSVTGAAGNGEPNIPVSILDTTTNTTTSGLYTDNNGCLFYPGLGTDQYQVQLSKSGWVDPNEATVSKSAPFTVSAGTVESLNPNYDDGGFIDLSYSSAPVLGPIVSVYNSNASKTGQCTTNPSDSTCAVTGSDSQVGPLYPFSDGYAVSVNGCPTTGLTASAPGNVAPGPGGTATAPIQWPTDTVTVFNKSGLPDAGGSVTVTCPDGATVYTFPGTISALGTITAALPPLANGSYYTLTATDSSGRTVGSATVGAWNPSGAYSTVIGTPAATTTTTTTTTSSSTTTTTTTVPPTTTSTTSTTSTTKPTSTTSTSSTTSTTKVGP